MLLAGLREPKRRERMAALAAPVMVGNITANDQVAYRQHWNQGMLEHYRDQRCSHVLTLSWNTGTPLPVAREHLRLLHAKVDRKLLGCRFAEKAPEERSKAAFVFEGIGSHLHVHSLWRIRLPKCSASTAYSRRTGAACGTPSCRAGPTNLLSRTMLSSARATP
jgi:hypothetical protein